jgi:hypothetical protein
MKMGMEHWRNDNHRRQKHSEKNHSHCSFVHQKSHMVCPEIEHILRSERPVTNRLIQKDDS